MFFEGSDYLGCGTMSLGWCFPTFQRNTFAAIQLQFPEYLNAPTNFYYSKPFGLQRIKYVEFFVMVSGSLRGGSSSFEEM
jgi:hypothetical protein